MTDETAGLTLSARDLWRKYDHFVAVHEVNLQLKRGEVLGLLEIGRAHV